MQTDIISEFLDRYAKEYDFYRELSQVALGLLDSKLRDSGIRAIVTARAKSPERLEDKVRKRMTKKRYASVEAIYTDLVDLAGLRVALYFPGDRIEAGKLIDNIFDIVETKEFPESSQSRVAFGSYKKRFHGYAATHYRVKLLATSVAKSQRRYLNAQVEVQVASVLMHAWSEVEHDLIYKPLQGSLSTDEYAILDELNGLVLAGEISLERLQRAVETRVTHGTNKFSHHYELAAFLYDAFKLALKGKEPDSMIGNVQALFRLMEASKKNSRDDLQGYIARLSLGDKTLPIAAQLADLILFDHPERYKLYQEIKKRQEPPTSTEKSTGKYDYERGIGSFLKEWMRLECIARKLSQTNRPSNIRDILFTLSEKLDPTTMIELEHMRRIRNNLVHGIEIPDPAFLCDMAESLKLILEQIKTKDETFAKAFLECSSTELFRSKN